MKYKETLLFSSVFLLGKKKSKISGIYFHASFSTKFKCKHPAKLAFLCQDGLSWGSHLLPWYKRENGRPRCPGIAPSLSDSWCCQESLLLLSADLLAKAGSAEAPPPPCPPVSLIQEQCRYLLFSSASDQQAPVPSLLLAASSVPACLPPPPGIQTLQPSLPRRGLGPINLWTNVKESGGGATFQGPRPKEQIKPDVCRAALHQGEPQQLPTQSAGPS